MGYVIGVLFILTMIVATVFMYALCVVSSRCSRIEEREQEGFDEYIQ